MSTAEKTKIPPPPEKPAEDTATATGDAGAQVSGADSAQGSDPEPQNSGFTFEPTGSESAAGDVDNSAGSVGDAPEVAGGVPLNWSVETGVRGVVVTVVRGGDGVPTTTFEEVLDHGATDAAVEAAKARLHKRATN